MRNLHIILGEIKYRWIVLFPPAIIKIALILSVVISKNLFNYILPPIFLYIYCGAMAWLFMGMILIMWADHKRHKEEYN